MLHGLGMTFGEPSGFEIISETRLQTHVLNDIVMRSVFDAFRSRGEASR